MARIINDSQHNGKFPWLCCNVCTNTSDDCSGLFITKLCAHIVCGKCSEKGLHNYCPKCKKQPVQFTPINCKADGGALQPYLDDIIESTIHLQKILELQNKHYVQSCIKEREVMSCINLHNIPVVKLEKETLQLERKCKQMREWKSANADLLASHDHVLKHLLRSGY